MDYTYFEMVYTEDCRFSNEDDSVYKWYIDGYKDANCEEEGTVICVIALTTHGDIVVDWHHNGYRMDKYIMELIEIAKKEAEQYRLEEEMV